MKEASSPETATKLPAAPLPAAILLRNGARASARRSLKAFPGDNVVFTPVRTLVARQQFPLESQKQKSISGTAMLETITGGAWPSRASSGLTSATSARVGITDSIHCAWSERLLNQS